jgi:xanthine/uracil/vitamin C permease (AzgA family)
MTTLRTLSRSPHSLAAAVVAGVGLFILLGSLQRGAIQLSCPLGITPGDALGLLPSLALSVVSQALLSCLLDHQLLLQDFFQMLLSFWLLFVLVGAVFFRAAFASKSTG